MEEETKQETIEIPPQPPDRAAEKARTARLSRERTARLNALGLSARGKPKKDRSKYRDPVKQRRYQANFSARHKAARERLGLTIAEFNRLPRATRLMEMGATAGSLRVLPPRQGEKAERERARQRAWYQKNKARKAAALPSPRTDNGIAPALRYNTSVDRTIRWCPCCGWNIDAMRKAQAFVDGRVS